MSQIDPTDFAELKSDVRDIRQALVGDVTTGKPGLHSRVGLLERSHGNVVKLLWIVVTTLVGSGIVAVKAFFQSGGGNPHP